MAAFPSSAIIFLLGIASRKKDNRSSRAAALVSKLYEIYNSSPADYYQSHLALGANLRI